ncbi:hypothetical protein AK812_SmicGene15627 [Symbiodinium microadriaticum]|uniref:Uncharacterized protein n=1 Tax=Symbiodinium microadriaticum TaxID=2951 RepID=A0A1Q9E2H9_SYMMI|nr:hypothetical protein AK812_SmicGene15627 [Symbiodinium microadriaticum]
MRRGSDYHCIKLSGHINEFVIFDPAQVYVEYVVWYKRRTGLAPDEVTFSALVAAHARKYRYEEICWFSDLDLKDASISAKVLTPYRGFTELVKQRVTEEQVGKCVREASDPYGLERQKSLSQCMYQLVRRLQLVSLVLGKKDVLGTNMPPVLLAGNLANGTQSRSKIRRNVTL